MTFHLPDEVRAALTDAGLSDDEVLLTTGEELVKTIGGQLTYELIVALAGQNLAVAHYPGRKGRIPQDDLIERNLDILKLRIVDGMTYAAIGREVGLTGGRVTSILHDFYGFGVKAAGRAQILYVAAADVPVLRDAALYALRVAAEDLAATLATDPEGWYAKWHTAKQVMDLLLEIQKDKDTAINVGNASHRQLIKGVLEQYPDDDLQRLLVAMP